MVDGSSDAEDLDKKPLPANAPQSMTPRRPVLEEPLDDPPLKTGDQKPSQTRSEQRPPVDHRSPKDLVSEGKRKSEKAQDETLQIDITTPEAPTSPYFPRGIFEDAQAVEAFYGRQPREIAYDPFETREADSTFSVSYRIYRIILGLLSLVVLLGIILMAVSNKMDWLN